MEDGDDGPGLDPAMGRDVPAGLEPEPEPEPEPELAPPTSDDRMWRTTEVDNLANVQTTTALMGPCPSVTTPSLPCLRPDPTTA